jgi:hypothetical protein
MTRLRTLGLLLLSAGALTLGATAMAHHSYAATYFLDKKIEIKGEVVVFMYRNPHSVLQVMAPGADGKNVRWACEWAGTRALDKGGISNVTLKPGDKVIITGLLGRNAQVPRLFVTAIQRPADGWKWAGDSSQ